MHLCAVTKSIYIFVCYITHRICGVIIFILMVRLKFSVLSSGSGSTYFKWYFALLFSFFFLNRYFTQEECSQVKATNKKYF